jgi:hypothetical protein
VAPVYWLVFPQLADLAVGGLPLAAARLAPLSATIRFEHISIEQGLSQSAVAILQDRFGFMWFGADSFEFEFASLKVTVVPPFWETWTFRAALILALVFLGGGAVRWRITSIERRNRKLALEVAERTLTIAVQTADLEALYQADEELERHVQLDEVLQALVDIAVDRLHADKAVLAWDDRHERLVIRAMSLQPTSYRADLVWAGRGLRRASDGG